MGNVYSQNAVAKYLENSSILKARLKVVFNFLFYDYYLQPTKTITLLYQFMIRINPIDRLMVRITIIDWFLVKIPLTDQLMVMITLIDC